MLRGTFIDIFGFLQTRLNIQEIAMPAASAAPAAAAAPASDEPAAVSRELFYYPKPLLLNANTGEAKGEDRVQRHARVV